MGLLMHAPSYPVWQIAPASISMPGNIQILTPFIIAEPHETIIFYCRTCLKVKPYLRVELEMKAKQQRVYASFVLATPKKKHPYPSLPQASLPGLCVYLRKELQPNQTAVKA